ncbi:MAG: leucyl/phenylalanyl-tRNA--protein transferase [Pirellulales bacterium]|nr:leucyl/phenylalanyl-tRNA--protein transferase [Pirellulales bacterium]
MTYRRVNESSSSLMPKIDRTMLGDIDVFPDRGTADEYGLLCIGGELTPWWVLAAYFQGIFPWPIQVDDQEEVLGWFCPDPRAVIPPGVMHIPKRLQRKLRSGRFRVTSDQAFDAVIAGCAGPRQGQDGTWITAELIEGYRELHQLGFVHSLEVWESDTLVGGVYGLSIGGYFSAESMFHTVSDASKAALAVLGRHLVEQGFTLWDIQQNSEHCSRLGAIEMPREAFLAQHAASISLDVEFGEIDTNTNSHLLLIG